MKRNSSDLLEEFSCTAKLLSKYQLWYYRKLGPSSDPHRGQGRVLALLKLQPEISQKELSYLLDMRNQSLGELLVKLEKSGAITREPSEEDRRSMNIKLTQTGAELIRSSSGKPDDAGKIFDCLSVEDRDKLREILASLSSELKRLLGNYDDSDRKEAGTKNNNHHRKDESGGSNQNPSSDDAQHKGKPKRQSHRDNRKEVISK